MPIAAPPQADPCVLPAAGKKTDNWLGPNSQNLASRQDTVARWQLQHGETQRRLLQKVGHAAIFGGSTPTRAEQTWDSRLQQSGLGSGYSTPRTARSTMHLESGRTDPRLRRGSQKTTELDALLEDLRRRHAALDPEGRRGLEQALETPGLDEEDPAAQAALRDALLGLGLVRTEEEWAAMACHLGAHGPGDPLRAFLSSLRGQLSERRRRVVHEVFDSIDADRDGLISREDLRQRHRAFQHKEVRPGNTKEDRVFAELLDCFDTLSRDGKISRDEFERYYEHCSAANPSDRLFVDTVRNGWNLPGATGGTRIQVRVTRLSKQKVGRSVKAFRHPSDLTGDSRGFNAGIAMTTQELVELRPDLGMTQHDPRFGEAVMSRLRQMGFDDVIRYEVVGRERA